MFIGWAKAPVVDRRFLLAALPLGGAGLLGFAGLSASMLDDPGAGSWQTGATHKVTGALVTEPYPMIRISDPTAPFGVRTVLIVAQAKCTSSLTYGEFENKAVTASGVLIERKSRQMLEVPLFVDDWLEPAQTSDATALAAAPEIVSLGSATLSGFIMDSKCFFGVMRPGTR